ncbi:MAG: hypothetical protein HN932_13600 [Candidatus Marinimicrobia bacterium]|jgi:hypothetical protein|nr:hypothetical protein [Candidatus Neomarinimicrobiota bacterium]
METQESVVPALYPNGPTGSANGTALFSHDPEQAFTEAQRIVNVVAKRCTGPGYLVQIGSKTYPTVSWWTVVGASLGLFARVVYARRLDREDEIAYESRVEIHKDGNVIASGEAMCSSKEERWAHADEYAIKSMSSTRSAGKCFRLALSFIAILAGLDATPAEEVPVAKNTTSPDSATAPQIASITRLARDQRLTDDERMRIQGLLLDGMSKAKASEVMEYFYGKSIKQGSEWIRVEEGVLSSR